MSSPATFTYLINGMFWVNVNLWIINKLWMKTWVLDDQSVYGWFLLFKCLVEAPEQTHISWAGGTSNDTHCTLKEGRSCPCLEDSLSWCTTREAQFISTFHSKCIKIFGVSCTVQTIHGYIPYINKDFCFNSRGGANPSQSVVALKILSRILSPSQNFVLIVTLTFLSTQNVFGPFSFK